MRVQNSIRDMFFDECDELLEALTDGLSRMAAGDHGDETVNAVFRAVHSIKGGAGAFALTALVAFAHRFETTLEAVRCHKLLLDAAVLSTLQRSADHLADLVESARSGVAGKADGTAGFLAALDACLGAVTGDDVQEAGNDGSFEFTAIALDLDGAGPPAGQEYSVTFRPLEGLYKNGHDPALLIASLADFGALTVNLDLSRLPELAAYDARKSYLAWTMRLVTEKPETTIAEVFEFVEGLCLLQIRPLTAAEPPPQPQPQPVLPMPMFERRAEPRPGSPRREAAPPTAARDDAEGGFAPGDSKAPKPTLRVDLDRVDRLINAVGELIINQSMIAQRVHELRLATDADVVTHVEDYRLLARDIQEAVMAIRAQPVKPLFQRMARIVREAAESTGKSAQLVTHGEGAEVDKTLVERLADPLTHMIRNAVDHGLETPEGRIAAGKDPQGTIHLSAAHRSGSVIITIRDDGAGLDRPKILQMARRKNLVSDETAPSDAEIDALLFLPGFSTASTVSNLSGRGVGLDVVRNAVAALGGRVSITSTPGQGTEFTISLPLTMAVLDGLLVSVAGQVMVIPIISILETIRPGAGDTHMIGTSDRLLSIRGKFIPMVDVARGLGFARPPGHPEPHTLLLVETENQGQCALIVDRVFDQRQVVIKGLDTNYGAVPGVSAATVLGDGQIALILDPDAIANNRVLPAPDHRVPGKLPEGKRLVIA